MLLAVIRIKQKKTKIKKLMQKMWVQTRTFYTKVYAKNFYSGKQIREGGGVAESVRKNLEVLISPSNKAIYQSQILINDPS